MSYVAIRLIVLACIFGAALLGLLLRPILPERHRSADSKDTVRLGIGMIASMAALVLGLLVGSAKNFYDTQGSDLTQIAANVVLLDRVLAHYGPETKEVRDSLRGAVACALDLMWRQDHQEHSQMTPTMAAAKFCMIKFRRYLPRSFNAHSRPRLQVWPSISAN